MIDKIDRRLCTGCNSCINSCSKNAIEMLVDYEGFWYPKVNKNCTKCGVCVKKCPSLQKISATSFECSPQVFAAWNKDEDIRYQSTSGGIFTELAKTILQQGGYVVGAQYVSEFMVEHYVVDNMQEIGRLRQSKYLQSDIGDIYKKVLNLLEGYKSVIFCGTPCQIAGLRIFLGKEYLNLITCDFICRGVISPLVYRKYLDMLENRYNGLIKKVVFKDKSRGWNGFCTRIEFEDGSVYIKDRNSDPYMLGYLKYNLYLRPSCHKCRYKRLPRISDITLGDFWGIGKTRPHLDEDRGTSVVLLNSKRGKEFFEYLKPRMIYEECTFEEILDGNPCLLRSVVPGEHREKFFEELLIKPFDLAFFEATGQRV